MKSINFSTGYKEYIINGDENNKIRININDMNIPSRIKEVQDFFDEMAEKYKDEDRQLTVDELCELDKTVREKINYAFGSDICTPAFGNINCMSPVSNGKMLFQAFFEELLPVVEADRKASAQAQAVHIEEKANKYIAAAQSAPVAPQIAVSATPVHDIANLTQEQKAAMFDEMMRQGK